MKNPQVVCLIHEWERFDGARRHARRERYVVVVGRLMLWGVVASLLVGTGLVAGGVPPTHVIPPFQTVVLLIAIPVLVGIFGPALRTEVRLLSDGRRRPEVAEASPLRRRGETTSGSSTPSTDRASVVLRPTPVELPDRLTG